MFSIIVRYHRGARGQDTAERCICMLELRVYTTYLSLYLYIYIYIPWGYIYIYIYVHTCVYYITTYIYIYFLRGNSSRLLTKNVWLKIMKTLHLGLCILRRVAARLLLCLIAMALCVCWITYCFVCVLVITCLFEGGGENLDRGARGEDKCHRTTAHVTWPPIRDAEPGNGRRHIFVWLGESSIQIQVVVAPEAKALPQRLWSVWRVTRIVDIGRDWTRDLQIPAQHPNHYTIAALWKTACLMFASSPVARRLVKWRILG